MSQISIETRDILDKGSLPEHQKAQLGTSLYELSQYAPVAITKAITKSAASAVEAFVAPFAMRIVDVIVQAQENETNGTLQPLKAAAGMCTAIACAEDGAVTHMSAGATAATDANRVLAAGDTVNLIATGTAAEDVRGIVTFIGVRL